MASLYSRFLIFRFLIIWKKCTIPQNMRNLNAKMNVINHFFDKILFFELLPKKGFHGRHNLEIFVVGLKNTVFQICSFPLQELCIEYRRTYLRQKKMAIHWKKVCPPAQISSNDFMNIKLIFSKYAAFLWR